MANSGDGDKFRSLIIPNCRRTASQEEKLHSCPFARQSILSSDSIQATSSKIDTSEQVTGIEIITLPESSDEYHTPPDHHSCSQNSSNDANVPPTKISAFDQDVESRRIGDDDPNHPMPVDDYGEPEGRTIVDLTKERDDNQGFGEKSYDVVEDNNTCTSTHQVFVEMPQREKETGNKEKRKLPFSVRRQKENSNCCKHETFMDSMNRVLKMVGEGGSRGGGQENDDADVDINFVETAKMRGLTLPRPRWWPAEGFKD